MALAAGLPVPAMRADFGRSGKRYTMDVKGRGFDAKDLPQALRAITCRLRPLRGFAPRREPKPRSVGAEPELRDMTHE